MSTGEWAAVIGLGMTFLLNFAGLVWGAAHLSSSIGSLAKITDKLEQAVKGLDKAIGKLQTRVAVLENEHERGRDA